MITLKCIEIYKKYGGNEDGFLRCATSEERLLLNYSCWILLDEFVQDLIIVKIAKMKDWEKVVTMKQQFMP